MTKQSKMLQLLTQVKRDFDIGEPRFPHLKLKVSDISPKQDAIELYIRAKDNVRKWLNGALMLKYRDRLDAKRRELGRTFGEIRLQEDGLEITEDRPMVLEWQKDKLKEYAKRIAANGGNPEDYMDIDYTISEKKYCSLGDEARKSLNAAGNIRPGCTVITLTQRETAND